jgi:hypothetical protein
MEVQLLGKLRSISSEPSLRGTTSLAPGDLTMVPDDAGVDVRRWRRVELFCGIACPMRDADWGTNPTQTEDEQFSSDGQAASCVRDFSSVAGGLAGRFTPEASAEGHVALHDAAGRLSSQLQLPSYAVAFFSFPHPAERAR